MINSVMPLLTARPVLVVEDPEVLVVSILLVAAVVGSNIAGHPAALAGPDRMSSLISKGLKIRLNCLPKFLAAAHLSVKPGGARPISST